MKVVRKESLLKFVIICQGESGVYVDDYDKEQIGYGELLDKWLRLDGTSAGKLKSK